MSDRYLFRGKRKDNGEWVYGSPVKSINDRVYMIHGATEDAINTKNEVDFIYSEVIPETVGQWTGLEDRNGKKIFEGDIVEYSQTDNFGGEQGIAVVYWCDKCVGFRPFSNDNEVDGRTWDYIIKLGNSHDNPELLEGA